MLVLVGLDLDKLDKIWRRYGQGRVLCAGEGVRRRETTLRGFPPFFFGWTRGVYPSLYQRGLVCSNRMSDDRSAVCPFLPKMDIMTVFAIFRCFWRYWTGCGSVVVCPIWADWVALVQGGECLFDPPREGFWRSF